MGAKVISIFLSASTWGQRRAWLDGTGGIFSCCGYFPMGAPHHSHELSLPPTPFLPIPCHGSEKALFILI